jgi:hypothetical protein
MRIMKIFQRKKLWLWFAVSLVAGVLLSGCQKAAEKTSPPTQLFPAATLTPQPETATLTAGGESPGSTAYPLPDENASPTPEAYPPPQEAVVGVATALEEPYPAPQDEGVSAALTGTPLPAPSAVTPTVGPAPTERIPQPFDIQVTPLAGKVSIYHSWKGARVDALLQIVRSFQEYYPDVVFDLTYLPQEELLARYTRAASVRLIGLAGRIIQAKPGGGPFALYFHLIQGDLQPGGICDRAVSGCTGLPALQSARCLALSQPKNYPRSLTFIRSINFPGSASVAQW